MITYKIHIDNRNYGSYTTYDATTLEPTSLDNFSPIDHKLFSNDIFTYNNGKADIIYSSMRVNEIIPAVLIIADNKTYGREKREGKKEGRLLYKCVPDDTRIPIFLVPYEIKHMGFSKAFHNMYVTLNYKSWTDKHPIATIDQMIGPVDVLDNFYEYQLYCKSLNTSIQKFNKDTAKAIKDKAEVHDAFISNICKNYSQIEDRTDWKTFTIDPSTSLDYDDGFSIKKLNDGQTMLSIYIANVTVWMDSLNLWSSFSKRISTIYLPDRKRPMLPTILSDCLCSLQANNRRFAFVLDLYIDQDFNISSIKYSNCLIKVFKNFAYEEPQLLIDPDYKFLYETTKQLSAKYKYISNIRNSHDIVCYLMILMNYTCAKDLLKSNTGIFRSTIMKNTGTKEAPSINASTNDSSINDLPEDVAKFIKIWNSSCGQYVDLMSIPDKDKEQLTKHDFLELDAYIHITSPIRRLVDLLNIIQFQKNHNLISLSSDADEFYKNWIGQIDYINSTMRAIRKVQNDCNLLDMCHNDPATFDKIYDGYCFDKITRNDGFYNYNVYLPELRITSKFTVRDDLADYEKRQYKLFLFNNEEKFKKKIRLQLVS